jgi:hypothetical protein
LGDIVGDVQDRVTGGTETVYTDLRDAFRWGGGQVEESLDLGRDAVRGTGGLIQQAADTPGALAVRASKTAEKIADKATTAVTTQMMVIGGLAAVGIALLIWQQSR